MSSLKKVQINPDFFKMSSKKTRKNGNEKKTQTPIRFIKHKISKRNRWLYPTDSFGKLEKGVVVSSEN